MKKYPNVTLKIIFRYKDKILMLRNQNGGFEFPGGRMEWGESILGTLGRELKEELNYDLKEEPELFSVWNYVFKNGKRHSVFINYIYRLNKMLKFSSPEKLKILWLTKKEILNQGIIKEKKFIDKIYEYRIRS
jgi:ADP-ribose pyrophosphatase YjhB (NUDIX family)